MKLSVCDPSAKRFAQDDGFVGGLEYKWLNMQKTRKDQKKSQALRMTILWEFDENTLKQVSAHGTKSRVEIRETIP